MTAYEPEQWHDLLVTVGGAAAALAGLLFVAVSLNIKQILEAPALPRLAARSLSVLLALLLLSLVVLAPGQTSVVLGAEITALGLALSVAETVSVYRSHFPVVGWSWTDKMRKVATNGHRLALTTVILAFVSAVPMVIGGVSLMIGAGGGLYWIMAEIVAGFSVAIYNAWILLVEIKR